MFTNCRCSPEDHAILEAEYKKNPKPDKAARVEIVNRVALGEKEVQVGAFKSPEFLMDALTLLGFAMMFRMCADFAAPRYGSKIDDR